MSRTLIVGAGPAGLTAAYELTRRGQAPLVLEQSRSVGGLSRTVVHHGHRFDIGGHRFFTKVQRVEQLWHEWLASDLLERRRLSRIFYRGTFFDYPLRPLNALRGLGPVETARVLASFARAKAFPPAEERTFEQWVVKRFGRRLYEIFFKTYTEKVWGMPCSEIGADWASQRIKNLDLARAVWSAFRGEGKTRDGEVITTLIDAFQYPRLGPGMMWERCRDLVSQAGGETRLDAQVQRIRHRGGRVVALDLRSADGQLDTEEADAVVSSMPVRTLLRRLDPPPPPAVRAAAESLRYRDYLTVALTLDIPDVFPDHWVYVHSPDVSLGRIQNYKNWSPEMVPDSSQTTLGLEYFVSKQDRVWKAADDELHRLGEHELRTLGLVKGGKVIDAKVVRAEKAYPVYDQDYAKHLDVIRKYLATLTNLQLIGRNGQHRYNNQDHSMLTGLLAAENLDGADHDLWAVNTEAEYHEDGEVKRSVDRAVPSVAG